MKNKLFRHYKNKNYKYLGEALHSETLENLVYYECLHENELSPFWVRPKEMFFGDIEIDGKMRPRFSNVEISLRIVDSPDQDDQLKIVELLNQVFDGYQLETLASRLEGKSNIVLVSAYDGSKFIGFKLGYSLDDNTFYSWLGAIDPEYRGVGIGRSLLETQHHWCREKKFSKVRTKTLNRWKSMLILNIKMGFDIVGTETSESGETKIVLEKSI